jgi:hypothetical protein
VIVSNLDLFCARFSPDKTNAILVIDPNAMLPSPVTLECFEPVGRGNPEIIQGSG